MENKSSINLVNLQEVREKLVKSLDNTGWDSYLRTFLISEEFMNILEILYKQSVSGKRFTPVLKDVFNAFKKCHFDDVRVVIIGQDPYPQKDVADGLAFSCSKNRKPESSLYKIMEAVENTVDEKNIDSNKSLDLTRWANQGVLLINTAFTTTINKPGAHHELWKDFFLNYVLESLIFNKPGNVIYIFLGSKAESFSQFVPDNNIKLFATHPAYASYKEIKWDCNDIFNKVNELLTKQNKPLILW